MNLNKYVDKIEDTRRINNALWMQILRIALDKAPKETKHILKHIRKNDLEISRLTGKLVEDGNRRKKNRRK